MPLVCHAVCGRSCPAHANLHLDKCGHCVNIRRAMGLAPECPPNIEIYKSKVSTHSQSEEWSVGEATPRGVALVCTSEANGAMAYASPPRVSGD